MHTAQEIEEKFWKSLKSDRIMMLGMHGVDEGHVRPMTAQFENDQSPIWFFSSRDTELAKSIASHNRAIASFTSKGHDIMATIHGTLSIDTDHAVVERLWNPFVAAWYEGGKDDPALVLFRLDAESAEIWLDGSSILAGVKMLFGIDPKTDYRDNVAKVRLD